MANGYARYSGLGGSGGGGGGGVTSVTASSPISSSGGTTPNISLTGIVPVANGGTSLGTLTANNVILGNGTSAPLFVDPSTAGNVLTSDGTTWISSPASGGGDASWTFPTPAFPSTTVQTLAPPNYGEPVLLGTPDQATDQPSDSFYLETGSINAVSAGSNSGGLNIYTGLITDPGSTGNSGDLVLSTGNNNGSGNSGSVIIVSGPATGGTTGNILFVPGNTTGTRGKIQFADGSEGTSGYVWTSIDTAGSGSWMPTSGGSGSVTSVSVVSANGLAGTVATATTTPSITLSTTITGILQGNGTAISAATTTGSGAVVLATSPTLVTPALGTPTALVGTNITGTAAGLTAGTVTTNANLTGDVTSVGNATTLATVNANVGSFGSSTSIPNFTVNAKGLITAAGGNVVIAPAGTLTGTTLNSTVVTSSLTSLGTQSVALNMGTHLINSVVDPVSAQDAATKNYVDTVASGLQPIQAVSAATTGSNISGTYSNGVAGVGATFTTTSTSTFTVDGYTPTLTQRILFKDQTSGFQNGVYNITQLATGVLPAIFTRALDYNTASDMNAGSLVPVINGTVNALTSWLQTATITTVGTDALVFTEWTANPANYLLKANNLSDVTSANTSFNNISPMTTVGDMIYEDATPKAVRLPIGTSGQFLQVVSGIPSWSSVNPNTPNSEVWVYNPSNSSGSSFNDTFATVQRNVGSDITYAVDTTNGDTFTINTDGIYSISYSDSFSSAVTFGISLNGGTATNILGQSNANVLQYASNIADKLACACVTSHLLNGDVLRANTQGAPSGAIRGNATFHITRVS